MINNVKDVMDFVYASYFSREKHEAMVDEQGPYHPEDDRLNRRPDLARRLLDALGSPDASACNVLVTGSKGKGSVSRLLERIIRAHGLKTGLLTSPHLERYNERIKVNGAEIRDDELVHAARVVAEFDGVLQSGLEPGQYISPMAYGLALGLVHFSSQKTQINILECGRGARYDDVAQSQADYAVINVIFDEHLPYLGQNVEDVAWHKAGVITGPDRLVFSAEQSEPVRSVLDTQARRAGSSVSYVPSECMDLTMVADGDINRANAKLALHAARGILGGSFSEQIALEAIGAYEFSGCMERIHKQPDIYLDGCIHPDCAKILASAIAEAPYQRKLILVGIPDNKKYQDVVRTFLDNADDVVVTKPDNCHLPFTSVQEAFALELSEGGHSVMYEKSIRKSAELALSGKWEGVYVIGTQIYLGQIRQLIRSGGHDR